MTTKKLFRLKSNPQTIVELIGDGLHKVYWSRSMEFGYSSTWMIGWFLPENSVPLDAAEAAKFRKKHLDFCGHP